MVANSLSFDEAAAVVAKRKNISSWFA
jgi:hypothetical protein